MPARAERHVWLSLVLFTLLAGVYFLTAGEGLYSIDGEVLFAMSWNLASRGSLAISCDLGVPGSGGRCFSNYEFLMPLASVPLVWGSQALNDLFLQTDDLAAARFFVGRFNQIVTALCGVLVFHLALQFYRDPLVSVIVALLYGIGTFAWSYSKFHFREPLTALTLLVGTYGLMTFFQSGEMRLLGLGTLGFALSTFTRLSSLLCFAWALLYAEYKIRHAYTEGRRRRQIRILLLGSFFGTLVVIALYNWYRFGSIIDFGYPGETWSTPLLEGVYGLLLSPGKGVFWYAPILVPSVLGMFKLYPRWRAEILLLTTFFLSYLLFHAGFWIWWGGDCWGPRYLVPVLPFLVLGAGSLLNSQMGWWLLIFFVPLSILLQILGVTIDYNYYATSIPMSLQLFDWRYSPLVHSLHLFNLQRGTNLLNRELALLGLPQLGAPVWRWVWGSVVFCSTVLLSSLLWRKSQTTTERSAAGDV
jgi:hypothetical protein